MHLRLDRMIVIVLLLLPLPAAAAQHTAFVLTLDFQNGSLGTIDLASRAVTSDVTTTYSDARVRWAGGLLYVVNRFGQDNIQVIDPAQNFATIKQFSVGNGSNPQDICVVSPTKAYVTRLASPRLLIVNPSTGDSVGGVSLAGLADADGLPEMDRMMRVGSRLFIAVERLAGFMPTDSSLIAVVDVNADTLVDADPAVPGAQGILLPGTNPITTFSYDAASGRLLIGCVGSYNVADGGIAWIDPNTLTSPGYAITETQLGGDVLDVVWSTPARSFAIVSVLFNTSLVAWRSEPSQLLSTIFAPGGFSLADAALNDRGELYVCDNDAFGTPGVFVFSAATGAALAGPLVTSLPPIEVAFDEALDPASTPVPERELGSGGPGLALSVAWPQPSRDGVHARLTLGRAATVGVQVLDLAGRRVRALPAARLTAGLHTIAWDGRDAGGTRVAPGVYVLAVRAGSDVAMHRVVMVR